MSGLDQHGRERVRVVCAKCNGVIAKLMEAEDGVWLNAYRRPRTRMADVRDPSGDRVPAPGVIGSKRLHGPDYADQVAWCGRDHAERTVMLAPLFDALERARLTGRVRRHAAQ